jgi:hypothetical protein
LIKPILSHSKITAIVLITVVAFTGIYIIRHTQASGSGLITRTGTKLMLNGQQYNFASLNANAMTQPDCGTGQTPTIDQINQFFSTITPHSMVRTWYFDETNQSLMDEAVAAATKYHDFLAVTLIDSAPEPSGAIGQCGALRPQYIGNFFGGGVHGELFYPCS